MLTRTDVSILLKKFHTSNKNKTAAYVFIKNKIILTRISFVFEQNNIQEKL